MATIEESINSILRTNTYEGDEIIVVDDFSIDNTANVLKKLKDQYSSIRVFSHKKNKGGGAARNTAIENARHELLFCLDSDNVLAVNSIAGLVEHQISIGADATAFGELWYFSDAIRNVTHKWVYKKGIITIADALAGHIFPGASGNYLFTKTSWENAGYYPEFAGAADTWGFGIRQLFSATKMTSLPGSGYFHRLSSDSYWNRESRDREFSLKYLEVLKPFFEFITEEDVEYMMGDPGIYEWMKNLGERPIRLRSGQIGMSGTIERDTAGIDNKENKLIGLWKNTMKIWQEVVKKLGVTTIDK